MATKTRRPPGEIYWSPAHDRYEVSVPTLDGKKKKTLTSTTKGTKQEKFKDLKSKLEEQGATVELYESAYVFHDLNPALDWASGTFDPVTAKAAATIRNAVRRDVTGRDRPTGRARMRLLARHAAAATRQEQFAATL